MNKPSPQPGTGGGGFRGQSASRSNISVLFDPQKLDTELFDTAAEEQVEKLTEPVNSTQLRRYFGELKRLYNQYQSLIAGGSKEAYPDIYQRSIEPRFKMLRSKIAYGRRDRARSKGLTSDFARVLEEGIGKVKNHEDFEKFVLHIEAVVGFMYGNGKVSKS